MPKSEKFSFIAVLASTKEKISEISKGKEMYKYEIVKLLVDKEYRRFKNGK